MTVNGTQLYRDRGRLPPLVAKAAALAEDTEFDLSCRPEHGRLLELLAGGREGGTIGETGTGCGVGLAWLATGAGPRTRIVSVEHDAERAVAASKLFDDLPHVCVLTADWTAIYEHGPFDLLVLDGGGDGKKGDPPVDPCELLRPGGTVVLDDFTTSDVWPPRFGDGVDQARLYWLEHPALIATELQLSPGVRTIVATRKPTAAS